MRRSWVGGERRIPRTEIYFGQTGIKYLYFWRNEVFQFSDLLYAENNISIAL